MIRVVFDTNVIVSAFLFGGLPYKLWGQVETGHLLALSSQVLLLELEETLQKDKFFPILKSRHISIQHILDQYYAMIEVVSDSQEIPSIVRDSDDDVVLACAVAGQAEYIVTGDKDLLILKSYQGIKIMLAAEFLALISEE